MELSFFVFVCLCVFVFLRACVHRSTLHSSHRWKSQDSAIPIANYH